MKTSDYVVSVTNDKGGKKGTSCTNGSISTDLIVFTIWNDVYDIGKRLIKWA